MDIKKKIQLPARTMPALGFSLWNVGVKTSSFYDEVKLIRQAYEVGFRVFDAAERYGNGGAEEILGEVFHTCRDQVMLGSKLSPVNLDFENVYDSVKRSCEESLERMQTDYMDMYVLHWPGEMTYWEEILEAFIDLKEEGKIINFGISHFDADEMKDWLKMKEAKKTAVCEGYFSLLDRRAENNLLPLCRKLNIPLMAYALSESYAAVLKDPVLKRIAWDRGVSPRQIVLAWVLTFKNVGAFSQPYSFADIQEVFDSQTIELKKDELEALEKHFPKPTKA